jgi:hypothetical protein
MYAVVVTWSGSGNTEELHMGPIVIFFPSYRTGRFPWNRLGNWGDIGNSMVFDEDQEIKWIA